MADDRQIMFCGKEITIDEHRYNILLPSNMRKILQRRFNINDDFVKTICKSYYRFFYFLESLRWFEIHTVESKGFCNEEELLSGARTLADLFCWGIAKGYLK